MVQGSTQTQTSMSQTKTGLNSCHDRDKGQHKGFCLWSLLEVYHNTGDEDITQKVHLHLPSVLAMRQNSKGPDHSSAEDFLGDSFLAACQISKEQKTADPT
jgi:hypothetical protein